MGRDISRSAGLQAAQLSSVYLSAALLSPKEYERGHWSILESDGSRLTNVEHSRDRCDKVKLA